MSEDRNDNDGTWDSELDISLKPYEREDDDLILRISELKSTLQKHYCQHRLAAMSCKNRFNVFYNYPMHALSLLSVNKAFIAAILCKDNPRVAQVLFIIAGVLALIQVLLYHSNKLASLDIRSRMHRIYSSKIFGLLENTRECHDEKGLLILESAYNTIDDITVTVLSVPDKIEFAFALLSSELKMQYDLSQEFNRKKGISSAETADLLFYHEILCYSYQELSNFIVDHGFFSLPDPEFVVLATLKKIKERIMGVNSKNLFAGPFDFKYNDVATGNNGFEQVSTCSSTESSNDCEQGYSS